MAKLIKVKLTEQMVEALEDGKTVHSFECVSGDKDHPTDKGTFKIFRKNHPYTNRSYGVPMNYAMFFTQDGKALHQYHGPGSISLLRLGKQLTDWVGSHGCVRLTEESAKTLYAWAPIGTTVQVV